MRLLLTFTMLATLAVAAPSWASNSSLLSGYSGPGGGVQTILGQQSFGSHGPGGNSGTGVSSGAAGAGLGATSTGAGTGGSASGALSIAQPATHTSSSVVSVRDRRTGQPVRMIRRVVVGPAAAVPPPGYELLAGRGDAASPLSGLSLALLLLAGLVLVASVLVLRKGANRS